MNHGVTFITGANYDDAGPPQALQENSAIRIASTKGSERSDNALLSSIAMGDGSALKVLFARHNVRVYRFALRLTGNSSIAEDAVSDAFLELWRCAKSFEARSKVSTWLLSIARHKALAAVQRRSESQLAEDSASAIEDPTDNPEETLAKRDRGAILQHCLRQLPTAQREVVDLVYYHGKSVAETAKLIGIPEGTVKTRMFYARNRMAKLLEQVGINRSWS